MEVLLWTCVLGNGKWPVCHYSPPQSSSVCVVNINKSSAVVNTLFTDSVRGCEWVSEWAVSFFNDTSAQYRLYSAILVTPNNADCRTQELMLLRWPRLLSGHHQSLLNVHQASITHQWVSEQFLNGTLAQRRLFSAIPLKVEKHRIFTVSVSNKTNEPHYKKKNLYTAVKRDISQRKKESHKNSLYQLQQKNISLIINTPYACIMDER